MKINKLGDKKDTYKSDIYMKNWLNKVFRYLIKNNMIKENIFKYIFKSIPNEYEYIINDWKSIIKNILKKKRVYNVEVDIIDIPRPPYGRGISLRTT